MPEESTEKRGGGSKLLLVLSLINLLGLAGAFGYFFLQVQQMNERVASVQELAPVVDAGVDITDEENLRRPGPMVDIGSITVNISEGRLLKTSLQLELDTEEARAEAESKIMQIRYHLNRLLAARRPDEVIGPDQMENLRKAMIRRADAVLSSDKGKVLNIWPQEWLVE